MSHNPPGKCLSHKGSADKPTKPSEMNATGPNFGATQRANIFNIVCLLRHPNLNWFAFFRATVRPFTVFDFEDEEKSFLPEKPQIHHNDLLICQTFKCSLIASTPICGFLTI